MYAKHLLGMQKPNYFLRFKKVGTLDWARPFPAGASLLSRANEGPTSSALPWPMAYRPWALVELTLRGPFVDTGRRGGICRERTSPIKRFYFFETEGVQFFIPFYGRRGH